MFLVQRLLHHHALVRPCQRRSVRCPIASDQERLQAVAGSRLDHRRVCVIPRQGTASRLAAAVLLQDRSPASIININL